MQTRILLKTTLAVVALAALLLSAASQRAEAQAPGRHPAYIHAIADLKLAHDYLAHRAPTEATAVEEQHALHEIDEAILVIKHASMYDGKDPNEHVAIDARIQRRDRFTRAREALGTALHDAGMEEDDPNTRGLQKQAIAHIHNAWNDLQAIMVREHLL